MRSIYGWMLGATAAAALAPGGASARQGVATFQVTAVVVRSVPLSIPRRDPAPSGSRCPTPAAPVAVSPSANGTVLFVDGAPTAFSFASRTVPRLGPHD